MTTLKHAAAYALGIAFLTLIGMTAGCGDNNSVETTGGLTESDAALIVANSFGAGTSTYGLIGQIEETASLATGGSFGKIGQLTAALRETTITRQKTSGVYTYSYTFHFSYGLVGASFDVLYDMKGTYTTPRVSSNDSANAVLHFTDLLANPVALNGTYLRLGSETFKIGETKQLNTTVQGTLSNITIDKNTKRVTGGTVALAVTAERDDGSTITLDGTLTFLGNHQATLVINGKTFALNLDYAEANPA